MSFFRHREDYRPDGAGESLPKQVPQHYSLTVSTKTLDWTFNRAGIKVSQPRSLLPAQQLTLHVPHVPRVIPHLRPSRVCFKAQHVSGQPFP